MMIERRSLILAAPVAELSIVEVWGILHDEISPRGRKTLEDSLKQDHLSVSLHNLACQSLSLHEYSDLQFINIKSDGPFLKTNFLFFESLSSLREATVAALNEHFSASLALLRTSLQQLVYHYWWRERLLHQSSDREFYDWLLGKKNPPQFRVALDECYQSIGLPPALGNLQSCKSTYHRLCAYSHTPTLYESLYYAAVPNFGGKGPFQTQSVWLNLASETLARMLSICIGSDPHSLFPVDLPRKFGFNPPMGALFDYLNVVPLKMALGEHVFEECRSHYIDHCHVIEMAKWYSNFRDLSDNEILASWRDEVINDEADPIHRRILRRTARMKARARSAQYALVYGVRDREPDEFMREWIELARLKDSWNDLWSDPEMN